MVNNNANNCRNIAKDWTEATKDIIPAEAGVKVSQNAPERRSGDRKFKPGVFQLQNYWISQPEICHPIKITCSTTVLYVMSNNNINNNYDDVYGAVIMTQSLREFTRFI